MESAFVVVVARHGRVLPDHAVDLLGSPSPSLLPFRAAEHATWQLGPAAAARWQRLPGGGRTLVAGERHARVFAGWLWSDGGPWPDEPRWASAAAPGVAGAFAAVDLRADGRATGFTDDLGLRTLYCGQSDEVLAVGSNPGLVAHALHRRPDKDLLGVCWLVHHQQLLGEATTWAGVRQLRPGCTVELDPVSGLTVRQHALPYLDGDLAGDGTLADRLAEHLQSALVAAARSPHAERHLDLTGGRDTRLLLAMALQAGVADAFELRTYGPPEIVDVQVAASLARAVGLPHRHERRLPAEAPLPYGEQLRDFVRRTNGMVVGGDARARRPPAEHLRVQGVHAGLRVDDTVPADIGGTDELVAFVRRRFRRPARLRLLHPDVDDRYTDLLVAELLEPVLGDLSPTARHHAFRVRNDIRRRRFGALEELNPEPRSLPLCTTTSVAAAFALDGRRDRVDRLYDELIARAGPALAEHPYAPDWRPPPGAKRPEPLMAHLLRSSFDQRRATLEEVLAERSSPVWEVADRQRALDALDRFVDLPQSARQELFGLVTAVLWMAEP